jgi:pimeloyl-ACP methyl ester carboxylesterase
VPLDYSGRTPGTLDLFVERVPAAGPSQGAVVALAGGPGQAAVPFTPDFADQLGPALRNRDLLVFDQRGTGRSGLLRCRSLERATGNLGMAVQRCASELGPRRAFYTTLESAEDVDAVRRAAGAQKVTLYGTSYGAKVALAYATRHPAQVDRLFLDSIVPLDGPDPFERDVFTAAPRALRALCGGHRCDGITSDPVADLAALVTRMQRAPLRGHVVSGDGRRRVRHLGRVRLLRVLLDGDLDPTLRAEFPAAVRAALRGDSAPILRLAHRAALGDLVPESPGSFSPALFLATTCEDGPLPWQPSASRLDRWGMAIARAAAIPDSAFFPFDRATGRSSDTLRLCADWPLSGPPPQLGTGPLPDVPALLLSGESDLRTPVEEANRVAAQLPRATHVVVPGVGHSVLLNDLSGCAARAVRLFFADRPLGPKCPPLGKFDQFLLEIFSLATPIGVPPRSIAEVPRAFRVPGPAGRTLSAVELTLDDALTQRLFLAAGGLGQARRLGGLRAGRILANGRLDRYSYVPGFEISTARGEPGGGPPGLRRIERVRVRGRSAARGFLRFDSKRNRVTGRLGRRKIRVRWSRQLVRLFRDLAKQPPPAVITRCCRFIR